MLKMPQVYLCCVLKFLQHQRLQVRGNVLAFLCCHCTKHSDHLCFGSLACSKPLQHQLAICKVALLAQQHSLPLNTKGHNDVSTCANCS